jgi:hypothetical protein
MSNIGQKLVDEIGEQAFSPKESSWFAMNVQNLPLHKKWIKKLTKHGKGAFMIIERATEGGNTYNTGCCVTQGHSMGLHNMMPLPTHRAMFIGQPEEKSDVVTATFRYISDIGLKDLTAGENNPIEFEWVNKLPCFPRALAIQEIDGNLPDEVCDKIAIEKDIMDSKDNEFYNHIPIAFPYNPEDENDQDNYWKFQPMTYAWVMNWMDKSNPTKGVKDTPKR